MKCISTGGNLLVRNGNATMTWRGTMHGKVGADGSLDMQTSASHLVGQFAASAFSGKLETPVCIWTVTLTKS